MVECPEGLGDDPEHWVARQVEFFTARGQVVEWKTYGYDEPADLPERLVRAGFVADDPEVVLLGNCADLVHDVEPAGRDPAARDRRRRRLGPGAGERRPGLGRGHLVGQRRPARRAASRPRPVDGRRRRGCRHPRGALVRGAPRAAGDRLLRDVGRLDPGAVAGSWALPRADLVPRPPGPRARLPLRPGGHVPRLAADPHRARDARRGRHPAVPARPLPVVPQRGVRRPPDRAPLTSFRDAVSALPLGRGTPRVAHRNPWKDRGVPALPTSRGDHRAHRNARGLRRHAGPSQGRLVRVPRHQHHVEPDRDGRDPRLRRGRVRRHHPGLHRRCRVRLGLDHQGHGDRLARPRGLRA